MKSDNFNAEIIQRKFHLPKVAAKKIQEANSFLADPNSVIKQIINSNAQQKNKSRPSRKKRKNKNSQSEFNIKNALVSKQINDMKQERQLINLQMKKYKPKNGSFSQLYGDQISIEDRKNNRFYGKAKIPNFNLKSSSSSKSRLHLLRNQSFQEVDSRKQLTERIEKKEKKQKKGYITKLNKIQDMGELLRFNSKDLYRKTDDVYNQTESNYEKLKESSEYLTTGLEKYHLDEEFSKTYRKEFHQKCLNKVVKKL